MQHLFLLLNNLVFDTMFWDFLFFFSVCKNVVLNQNTRRYVVVNNILAVICFCSGDDHFPLACVSDQITVPMLEMAAKTTTHKAPQSMDSQDFRKYYLCSTHAL